MHEHFFFLSFLKRKTKKKQNGKQIEVTAGTN